MLAVSSPLEAFNHRSSMPTSLRFESAASARPSEEACRGGLSSLRSLAALMPH